MSDIRWYELIIFLASLMGLHIWGIYIGTSYCKECPKQREQKEIIVKDTLPELTKENVLKEIIKNDIKHPLIVLRQVYFETGHLKCKNCSLNVNNLFGFSYDGKNYLKFNHWTESVKYYSSWQIKYYKGEDYYQFIDNIGYASDSLYLYKLKRIEI